MRPANLRLVIARAAALGAALVGCWSLAACAKTPAAVHQAEAAASPPKGGDAGNLPPEVKPLYDKLDDLGKKVFNRVSTSESSVCGDAQSLIKSWPSCRRSVAALRYVAKLIENGYTDSEISERLAKRYRPVTPKKIDVADAPMKGNPSAKITLIEFADYECPHCKRFQPVLHQIMDEFRSDVKLYFKHYPLPQHTNARLAAEAAVAAQKQGKFWQYQDKLWEKSDELTPAEIEKAAKEVGLDVTKFRQDVASEPVKARVQKDRADGAAAGIEATPTLYINGREYTDGRDTDSLREWIKDAIAG
ncbi:MAG TPA: thioredoxin domain-containing protein [Polyangia bacterium]|jgi:protein-disulfide isomerase|nr:thioredoxin domain-containing protein [Polyangia bacterium]